MKFILQINKLTANIEVIKQINYNCGKLHGG